MTTYPGTGVPRDNHDRHLAETYYGMLPVTALTPESRADIRAPSIPSKRFQKAKSYLSCKNRDTLARSVHPVNPSRDHGHEYPVYRFTKPSKLGRMQLQKQAHIELHQSTCLILNSANDVDAESDLWILPSLEEWEMDQDSCAQLSLKGTNDDEAEWAPLVSRAVNSNRERLRRRLEGDGWDFVCGKYGEDGDEVYAHHEEDESVIGSGEESVDEEFDVVVLAVGVGLGGEMDRGRVDGLS